eukprot:TRINITY_DN3107_c0_g1_i6.p1 TRINITY_DN3107_c0_g1~~TRINITY_DN3107_c0_g1_i6.p1  ORF type:complete len:319 (-),score=68.79 TRINITY_DN3107_c0_g1_i6:28-984(-)
MDKYPYCKPPNQCVQMSPEEVRMGVDGDSFFMTTFIKRTLQKRECKYEKQCGKVWSDLWSTEHYVAGIEDFQVTFNHYSQVTHLVQQKSGMWWLTDRDNTFYFQARSDSNTGCFAEACGDAFSGANEDDTRSLDYFFNCTGPGSNEMKHHPNARRNGAVVLVGVQYDNSGLVNNQVIDEKAQTCTTRPNELERIGYLIKKVDYRYSFDTIGKLPALVQTRRYINDTHRMLNTRNGINFNFKVAGSIANLSFSAFLISLVSNLALLKVSTLLVDMMAMRFFRMRNTYKHHKFEQTEDFGTLRKQFAMGELDDDYYSFRD